MLDKYHDEYAKILVPANLKAEVLLKMQVEKKKKQRWLLIKAAMVASCFVIAIVSYLYLQPTYIKTKLKSDSIIANVEVSDGNLVFEKVDSLKRFGSGFTTKKSISKMEAKKYLVDVIKDRNSKGFKMQSREYFGYYTNFALSFVEVVETYTRDNQKMIITYNNNKKQVVTNSTIGAKKVMVVYQEEKDTIKYSTLYQEDTVVYEIVARGVTQEQYIKDLVSFLKNF